MVTTRSPTGIRLKWAGGGKRTRQCPGPQTPIPHPCFPWGVRGGSESQTQDNSSRSRPRMVTSEPRAPPSHPQLASPLTERAGVLWGALDAPIRIRLKVETLAAEQFGDDAFELRLWRERHSSLKMTSLFPETFLHLAGSEERRKGEWRGGRRPQGPSPQPLRASSLPSRFDSGGSWGVGPFCFL